MKPETQNKGYGKYKKVMRIGLLLAALVLMLANAALTHSEGQPQKLLYISVEKPYYEVGEKITLIITTANLNNYDISIYSNQKVYKYGSELKNNIDFHPPEEGLYIVELTNKTSQAIVDAAKFFVGKPAGGNDTNNEASNETNATKEVNKEINETSQANQTNETTNKISTGRIFTNKEVYIIGELVIASVNLSLAEQQNYKLYYEYEGFNQRYMGDFKDIKFVPRGIGTHYLILKDNQDTEIERHGFEVLETSQIQPLPYQPSLIEPLSPESILQPASNETYEPAPQPKGKNDNVIRIVSSKGIAESATITIYDQQNNEINLNDSNATLGIRQADLAEIIPENKIFKKMVLKKLLLNFSRNASLGIDEIPSNSIGRDRGLGKKNILKAFAIDASSLNFTNGTVTGTAKGTELWKCKEWDFETRACLGAWSKIMDLVPGQDYELEISPEDPGYAETGVASINTKKPIYYQNETAEIIMVVIDISGHLVSNANVTLTIAAPDNTTATLSTGNGEITEAGKGIYAAAYSGTSLEGNYSMTILATGDNVNSTMYSYFTVKQYYEFDIIRNTPVTTDPWLGPIESSITIISHINSTNATTFNFTEVLPASFEIINRGGAIVTTDNNTNKTLLTWTGLSNNSVVNYSAALPLVTPELYQLGPALVSYGSGVSDIFYEARPWYLAVDPQGEDKLPDGDGAYTDWGIIGGQPTRWQSVDDPVGAPDDSTTYINSSIVNRNSFTFQNLSESSILAVNWVAVTVRARRESGGSATLQIFYRQGGTNYDNANSQSLTTTWTAYSLAGWNYTTNPATGAAWNESSINNMEWGVYRSAGDRGIRVTQIYVTVNFNSSNTPPNVTSLNYPGNMTNATSSSTISFNFTVKDDRGFDNCTLYTNVTGSWLPNASIANVVNNSANIINATLPDGNILWNVICWDNATVSLSGSYIYNYTVHVDATGPVTAINSPVNGTNISAITYALNATATDATAVHTVTFLYRQNSTATWNIACANSTATGTTYTCTWNLTGLPEMRTYEIRAYANDTYGHVGNNDTHTNITIDRTGPTTTINQPTNFTNISTSTYTLNASATDMTAVHTVTFLYRQNSTAEWTVTCRNSTGIGAIYRCTWNLTGLPDGLTYEIRAYANDTLGNTGQNDTRYNITIDRTGPNTTLDQPANFTNITTSDFGLNATATDMTSVDTVTFMYRQNATDTWHLICSDDRGPIYDCIWDLTGLPDSLTYEVRAYANDTVGNIGNNDTRYNITVDINGPTTTIISPQNGSNITNNTYVLNATAIDPTGVDTVTFLYRQNSTDTWHYVCSSNTGPGYSCTWNLTALPIGATYEVRAYANDTRSHIGNNDTRYNITLNVVPSITNTKCMRANLTWVDCATLTFGHTLDAVRTNCTSNNGGTIDNVSFIMRNIEDNKVYFNDTVTSMTAGLWVDNFTDFTIYDSGRFNLQVVCRENARVAEQNTNWTIPWGTLTAQLISPSTSTNVTQNRFFNFTSRITCTGGECGNASATLDPGLSTISPTTGTADNGTVDNIDGNDDVHGNYTSTWAAEGAGGDFYVVGDGTTGDNAYSYIMLVYNLTPINTPSYNVNRLTFNVSYCHSGASSATAVICNATDTIDKAFNGTQHVDIYNWTSSTWVNIGELTQDTTALLRMLNYTISGNLSYFINSSNMIMVRYEANFQSGGGDGFLAIDYAPLTVNFTQKYKSGIIPTTAGSVPFYTITANPMFPADNSCLTNMKSGTACDTTWTVNATGEINTTHIFWVIYDSLSYSANVSQANTTHVNITIIANIQPTVSNISILPDRPIFTDDINCTFTVTDPNQGDNLTAAVDWYKNGAWQSSQNYSVTHGMQKTAVLGSGNLSIGDVWHCGVTPYDQELHGSQVNSSQVTVLATRPPIVSDIQCLKNNAIWGACSAITYGQNLTQVRAKCNSSNGIVNASFSLRNVEDDYVFFSDTTSDNSSGYFTLNNPDVNIQDSGVFILNVTCVDFNGTEGYGNSTWTVPWGTLTVNLVYPNTSVNVTQNKFFNFTSNVSCSGGECGYILATLDPTATNLVAVSENHTVNPSETWTGVNGLSDTYTNNGGATGTGGYYIFGIQSGTTTTSHNITVEFGYNLSSLGTTGRQINSAKFLGELYLTGGGLDGPHADPVETNIIGDSYVQIYNGTGWENIGVPFINADTAFETGIGTIWDQTTDTNPENPLNRTKTIGFDDNYINSSGIFRVRVIIYNIMMDGTSFNPDIGLNWDYAWLTLNYTTNTKGVIPMYSGTPFYTITQNPANSTTFSCLANMKPGSVCNTTWQVNATGATGMPWEFFVTYQSINYSSWVNTSVTREINITIISNIAPNVTSISIAPTDPLPTENLNCTFTITDPNYFDTLTANVTWYRNNISNSSKIVSVSNGASYLDILGSGNLTLGDSWKCGVTPYDQELYGSQRNSSSVTVVLVKPPTVQQVQCLVNNSVWMNCQNISFGSNFSGVRANCTSAYNPVTNVTFNFSNTPDSRLFFQNTTNTTTGGWYTYYQNITINDSGEFILNAICSNNESATDTETLNWTVPWGRISISLITPNTNGYVEYNRFFNFTANISCRGGECGDLNAILDPISGANPYILTPDNGYIDMRDADDSNGTYASTWSPEGAGGAFYTVGDTTTSDNAYSYIVLLYNLSQTGQNNSYINEMIFNVSYCHSGDNSAALVNCNGSNAIEKAFNGAQNVDVYDWTSSTWVNIGNLTQDTTEALRMLNYSLAGNFSRYINSSKWAMVRYLANFTGGGGDGFLAIDYAPLTVNYAIKSGPISTTAGAIPFYTTTQNPANSTTFSCLANMSSGYSCVVIWPVNSTGLVNTTHEFYVISNGSTYSQYILQNESNHIWLTIQDTSKIPPVVTLNIPGNNTATQNTTITFNCSATSVSGLTSITLYSDFDGYFQENEAVSVSGLYNSTSFTRNLSEGKYTWNCKAVDINGNENFASNRTLTVDRSAPFINLSYPNDGDNISSQTVTFNFTVFDNLDDVLLCNLTIDSVVRDPNFSANNGTLTNRTVVGLGRGNHTWNVSCVDDAGNYNISESRNFTVFNIPPNITLLTIDNYMTNAVSFELYYLPNDTGSLLKTDLYINGTLVDTDPAPLNGETNLYTISDLDEGIYNWTVNVTNDADLTAEAPVRWFYIDRQAPVILLHFPPDNYSSNSGSVTFNFTAIDSISLSMNCQLNVNGSMTSLTANNNTPKTKTITGIKDGLSYWNVSCTDTAGNMNTSDTRMLNTSSPPTVALNSPADNYSQASSDITLIYTPSDNNNITSCRLILDGAVNQTNASAVNNAANTFMLSDLIQGAYNWSVNCTDDSGLNGSSATRRFSIDSTQPNITLNSPLPGDTVYGGTVIFNFTAYDNIDLTLTCNLTVDGNRSRTNIPSPNGQWVNVSVALNESIHYWNVSCADDAGNKNTSETRNFTLIGAPTVTIVFPPQNAILNYTQNINFTYVPSSTNSLNLSLLYINGTLNQTQNFPNNGLENYFFVNLSDGTYTWRINITDSVGLNGTSGLYALTIDSTPPIVSYNTPGQDQVISNNNVTFRFNVTDNLASSLICNVTISGTPEWTNINASNGATVTRYKLLNDSSYNWSVNCYDNANNTNAYALVNFTVEAPPNVTLNWPGQDYRTKNQDIMFNFTPRDDIGLENCTLIINDSIMNYTTAVNKNIPNYLSVTSLSEGNYNWTVECIDGAPDLNVFRAPGRNLSIDLSGPIITMNYPNPEEDINSDTIQFNWTATDYAGTNINCSLFIDGIFNLSMIQQSGSYFTPTIANFTPGYHNWSLNCSDDLNNSAVSEVRNFTINQPDLYIDSTRISFNNTNPDLYQNITIRANITNIGGVPADRTRVEFWDNGMPGTGAFIGNQTITVRIGESVFFNVTWIITPGYHTIYVLVDPWDNITEMNETNNNATTTISALFSNITYPDNNSLINNKTPQLDFNVTDYTANNITYKIYVDGIFNNQTANVTSGSNTSITLNNLSDGVHLIKVQATDSLNRSKNSSTINITIDTTAPTVNFETRNGSWFNYSAPTIYFNITDIVDTNISYSVYINGSFDQAGYVPRNTSSSINITAQPEGTYNITIQATDDANNSANYSIIIYINLNPPTIVLYQPLPGDGFNYNNIYFNWTATDFAGTYINCTLNVSEPLGDRNVTQNRTSGSYFNTTLNNLSEGIHYWNVTCIDNVNNSITSEARNFTINQPDLFIDSTRITFNNTNPDLNQEITIRANVTNIGGVTANNVLVEFWDNGMPGTGTFIGNATGTVTYGGYAFFNTTWNITEGYHTIYVLVDPQGAITELNETNNNATTNISVLRAYFNSPQNQTITNDTTPEINFTMQDFTGGVINYTIYVDGSANGQNSTGTDNVSIALNLSALSQGGHNVTVQARDALGRAKNSTIRIIIDTSAPIVNFKTYNQSWFNTSTPNIYFNITDNLDNNINYSVYVNGTFLRANNVSNYTMINETLDALLDGAYNITIQATDDAGNAANYTRLIYVDTTAPSINPTYPADTANFTNSRTVTLNFTATDNLDINLTCNLTLDGAVNRTNFYAQNASEINTTVNGLVEGAHYWNVTCWDHANNTNTDATRSFNIYISPNVTLSAPANGNVSGNSTQIFLFNVSDETGIFNCSLLLNGAINTTKPGSEITNNGISNFTLTDLNGRYNWSVTCFDNTSFRMQGNSTSRNLTVDTNAPYPNITTANYTWFNTTSPLINFIITDDYSNPISYTFYVNNNPNVSGSIGNNTPTGTLLQNITPDGTFSIVLQANDNAWNYRNSSSVIIYVDTEKPNINLTAPAPGESFNSTSVQFNFTPTDNMAGYTMCNLTISNGMYEYNINSSNNTPQSFNKSGFVSGTFRWNVSCIDLAGNRNTSETRNFTIRAPDLVITSGNISFSNSTPEESTNITVYANIFNLGGIAAYNITVQFWKGDPDAGGTRINGNLTIATLNNTDNYTVNVTYNVSIGYNNVFVVVDPPTATNGTLMEENESNNKANNSFRVGLYQVYAGNASGLIDLEKQSINISMYVWNVSSVTGSNIFVTDLEASIGFSNLQAIGINTTNGSTSNDFTDIDTKLGTTNYTDSINNTFTSAGAPKATRAFVIFTRQINNVPIINSTNTSSFVTGILWDASDGNTEYNGTQDIVFNTEINESQSGIGGTYDFEIKVPALLRNYNGAGPSLAFYYELK
jgi:hypothetical protein